MLLRGSSLLALRARRCARRVLMSGTAVESSIGAGELLTIGLRESCAEVLLSPWSG